MKVISLQSGSNGNSFYVEAANTRLLFDAGIAGRQAEERLAAHGREIRDCCGLFISHDHSDHTRSMGVYQRKFGIPLYVTRRTLRAVQVHRDVGQLHDVRHFLPGQSIEFTGGHDDPVIVHTIPTPHDGADGVAFVIEHDEKRVGILTDLGHVFDGLRDVLLSLDAVVIESNYDPGLLEQGPYPEQLKQRIRGRGGHISNDEAADLVSRAAMFRRLKWALLCHLSEENNRPELARQTMRQAVDPCVSIHVASRYDASEIMEV